MTCSKQNWLFAVALAAAVFLAYQPAWHDGFVWDDDDYVTGNTTLRDLNGLERIWFDRHANPQYYPLVHSSFWIEYHLWGSNPLGYHLVNVALHAANAVLLLLLLRRLGVPGALLAAGLFALHPVMVESVAWVTERKNVLSAFFYLCSFRALLRFWPPEEAKPRAAGGWRYYVLALLLFAAALCSKTVTCSLPAAFLLVRWWKRGGLTRRDGWIMAPFFVIGLVLALNTAVLEKQQVGASGKEWDLSALARTLIAGRALWFYVAMLVWPANLTFIYPRWQIDTGLWWQYLFPLGAVGAIGTLWALRCRLGRGPLTAALFFAGTLVPALGFVDVYPMRYSFVADHFAYLASVGLLALVGAIIEFCRSRVDASSNRAIVAANCLVLVVLAALTWRQVGVYKDLPTLWNDTLAKNPSCWLAHNNLGTYLAGRGQVDEAIAHYRKALEIRPDFAEPHVSLGAFLADCGQVDEAIAHYRKALEIRPDFAEAHNNFGNALADRGQVDEAIDHYRSTLKIKPDFAEAHNNLGKALAGRGEVGEAIEHYRKVLKIKPDYALAHNNLGSVLVGLGQFDEAIDHFRKALEIQPDFVGARNNLGNALLRRGQVDEAIDHFRKALAIDPGYVDAHINLGVALARGGQFDEAFDQYRKALEIKPNSANAHINFGNALARRGQVDDAVGEYLKALQIDPNFAEAHSNLGIALGRRGDVDQAIAHYQKAVEIKPDYLEARYNLGSALAGRGKLDEALEQYQKALALATARNNRVLADDIRSKMKLAGKE